MKQIDVQTALSSHGTFYAKQWQSNGYYPIDKFVWNNEKNMYEQFVKKSDKWVSRGCRGDNHYWQYVFEHTAFILSFEEMTQTRKYNCK